MAAMQEHKGPRGIVFASALLVGLSGAACSAGPHAWAPAEGKTRIVVRYVGPDYSIAKAHLSVDGADGPDLDAVREGTDVVLPLRVGPHAIAVTLTTRAGATGPNNRSTPTAYVWRQSISVTDPSALLFVDIASGPTAIRYEVRFMGADHVVLGKGAPPALVAWQTPEIDELDERIASAMRRGETKRAECIEAQRQAIISAFLFLDGSASALERARGEAREDVAKASTCASPPPPSAPTIEFDDDEVGGDLCRVDPAACQPFDLQKATAD